MQYNWLNILVISCGLAAQAQTVNLRGTVSSGGQPVSGAIVTLMKLGLKDTTGSDGAYAIARTITGIDAGLQGAGIISLSRGAVEFHLAEPAPVAIEVFDLVGNRLQSEKIGMREAGHYRWPIAGDFPADRILFIRASAGNRVSIFRYLPLGGTWAGRPSFQGGTEVAGLARMAAAVDSLEVTAPGYAAKKLMVDAYDAKLDFSVDKVNNGGDKWGGLKNPPGKSAGCGKATTITTGIKTITSSGGNKSYAIDIPANYDMNKPHLVIFIYHWVGGQPAQMVSNRFYNIKPLATAANVPTIFIAPNHGASQGDHAVFNDILTHVKANACVDTTRVFATGYSHGGMMTYSLTTMQQKKLRAGAGIAAANWNVWLPATIDKEPIAYMGVQAMQDRTCNWIYNDARKQGGKYIALEKATTNGCTVDPNFPHHTSGPHHVYEFPNCKPGYPVVSATFQGEHGGAESNRDPGESSSWVPREIWAFFNRF